MMTRPVAFSQNLVVDVHPTGIAIYSHVLMSNHYHLLVQTPEPNLGRAEEILKIELGVLGEDIKGLRSMAKNDERKQLIT